MRSGDLTEKPESPADPSEQFLTLMLEIDTALHESRIPQLHDSALRLLSPEERHKLSEACRHLEFLYADSPRSVRHSVPLTINHDQDQARHAGADCDVSLETKSLLSEFGSQFGRFDVLRGLGMGGHGAVFLARDPVLDRLVALKVPRPDILVDPSMRQRFLAEGRVTAQLMHPNIVTVFESGVAGAVCYLAQDYVPGPSLDAWLRQHGDPVAPRVAARTVLQLADAVALAHSQRILHRDIKPANILLAPLNRDCDENQLSTFVPKLTDFGIAKLLESDGYTITGDLVGTPAYMSPEQASGRSGHVDFRSDIYSLGTVLYELLTHQPVYRGDNSLEILREVQSGHIVRPKSLVADIPDDLEEVCLKCVRLDPAERYSSAQELADDLRRFLDDQPVRARPLGTVGQTWRWLKRHPERFGLIAAIVVSLTAITALGTWTVTSINRAAVESRLSAQTIAAEKSRAQVQEFYATAARISERSTRRRPGWSWSNLDEISTTAPLRPVEDVNALLQLRSEAASALTALDVRKQRELLPGFEAYTLAFSPDGDTLVVGANSDSDDRIEIAVIDTSDWSRLPSLSFATSKEYMARTDRPDGVRSLVFSADGSQLYAGSRGGWIHVFDTGSWQPVRGWQAHEHYIHAIRFSLDQKTIFTSCEDGSIKHWQLDGKLINAIQLDRPITDLAVVSGQRDSEETVVAMAGRVEFLRAQTLESIANRERRLDGYYYATAYPNGQALILGAGRAFDIYDCVRQVFTSPIASRRLIYNHLTELHGIDISSDGQWLVSSASDQLIVWDLAAREVVAVIPTGGRGHIVGRFQPSRNTLAVCGDDRVTVYDLSSSTVRMTQLCQSQLVVHMDLSRDGRYLAAMLDIGGFDEPNAGCILTVREIDSSANTERLLSSKDRDLVRISPDGRRLAVIEPSRSSESLNRLWIIDRGTLAVLQEYTSPQGGDQLTFSPDGQTLLYASRSTQSLNGSGNRHPGEVRALNQDSGQLRPLWTNLQSEADLRASRILSLIVNDHCIVCSSIDGKLRVLSPEGKVRAERDLGYEIDALSFTGNESQVVLGDRHGNIRLVTLPMLEPGAEVLNAHQDAVSALTRVGPDTIASGGRDGDLKLWKVEHGELLSILTLGPHSAPIMELAANSDGNTLAFLVERETAIRLLRVDLLRERLNGLQIGW